MKKLLSLVILSVFIATNLLISVEAKTSHVKGYKKKNGTYVNSHYRHSKSYKKSSTHKRKR